MNYLSLIFLTSIMFSFSAQTMSHDPMNSVPLRAQPNDPVRAISTLIFKKLDRFRDYPITHADFQKAALHFKAYKSARHPQLPAQHYVKTEEMDLKKSSL